ncbi:MAG: helicase [Proteobacteria bacterium]|nr:MAG: helicase [Pseudomonadota bacterium]
MLGRGENSRSTRETVGIVKGLPALWNADTTTEATFYPRIRDLLSQLLDSRTLPFEVRVETRERDDKPDLALYDRGDYAAVLVEVKLPSETLTEIAWSTDHTDQIGRYLAQTGVVIVSNVRSYGLLACKAGIERPPGVSVPPEQREMLGVAELWVSEEAFARGDAVSADQLGELADLLERAVTEFAPIADPQSLARILARQARRAKADLPARFDAVKPLLEDYKGALGLTFTEHEGAEFFRSSLIQTAYYGLFAGWALWYRANDGEPFEWDRMDRYLRIPFLGKLFYEFKHPDRLAELRLAPHLERAAETLGRVDTSVFFSRFSVPDVRKEDEAATAGALTYFYEPFLEAFDPELRKELGVWFTPPEIVRYQVQKIDRLLRTELGCPHGFADDQVVVLDPCCGTGAYLLEVVRCIATELHAHGDDALVGPAVLDAVTRRILGFELLTAPFVVAQLQIYLVLSGLGVEPKGKQRPGVFLTNALTGWDGPEQVKLHFPELQQERDSANRVKRDARIIVILGNPPYNRFAGTAIDEEQDLVDHYKGIVRKAKTNRQGEVVNDKSGRPVLVQVGDSALYTRFGISKQTLDDLYIRFFRLAEQRIGERAEYGVVSFISNSSYLTGRSHPLMRESLLTSFHEIWIDNTNGDKYRTGKIIPAGAPGAGSSDQSVFTTPQDSRGIQVGTCVSTFLKRNAPGLTPEKTPIHYRDFWGRAEGKRRALLDSLSMHEWSDDKRAAAAAEPSGPREYETLFTSESQRFRFAAQSMSGGYEDWPALDELFPVSFQGVNPNRGLDGSVIDIDREALLARMRSYLGARTFEEAKRVAPALAENRARYVAADVWASLRRSTGFNESKALRYLTFPFDLRWLYYERECKLLNERREEFGDNAERNEFLVAVPQARRISETRPLFATTLVDLHAHDRGSVCFPRDVRIGELISERVANLTPGAWTALSRIFGLRGERSSDAAKSLVHDLFCCVLALLHSPLFESDHRESLIHDWARVPIPTERDRFEELTRVGAQVMTLLDPLTDAEPAIHAILGAERANRLGVIRSGAPGAPDLRVTIS